ncbi:hypothetical protein [Paenibacillus silvisoli]|uniref:hypothetical protein n=1 Tax=Paenibacillus silvisoli TaxID=3110539 RepID=UPI002804FE2D|nr:hypothetical protein [Paenibacillus silvisoli]
MSRKKKETPLDTEAMKLGYQVMLTDVATQLEAGMHIDSIRTLLAERKQHIMNRLEELK